MIENKIKEMRKARKLTATDLAELCNTTQAQISRLENNVRALDFEWSERISKALGVKPYELLRDETWNPYAVKRPTSNGSKIRCYSLPVIDQQQACAFVFNESLNPKFLTGLTPTQTVHTIREVSRSAFAIAVNDDAMMPRFLPGDIIIIDPEQSAHVGEYCLFTYMDNICALRRLTQTDKYFVFEPINPIYPSLSYKTEIDVYDKILGKLIDLIPQLHNIPA